MNTAEEARALARKLPALNNVSEMKRQFLIELWDVCKNYGTTGECIWIVMKHNIGG